MHAQESGSNDHAFVSDVAVSSNDHLVIFSAQLVAYVPKNVITLLNHLLLKSSLHETYRFARISEVFVSCSKLAKIFHNDC